MIYLDINYMVFKVFSLQYECALAIPHNPGKDIPKKRKFMVENCPVHNVNNNYHKFILMLSNKLCLSSNTK